MAETKGKTPETVNPIPESNDVVQKAKGFWVKYSKAIIYVGGTVIVLIAGYYAYMNLIKLPKEKAASEMIFPAEDIFDKMAGSSFSKDSVNIALNGGTLDGRNITGLLKVISNYGGTKAGNRAEYMVGASYLQIGEFDKAIKYLKEFNGNGADQVQSKAYVMLGHAYAEKKSTNDALEYYKKAASVNEKDESITPDALMLAASYAQTIGNSKEAIGMYKKLKDNYPTSSSVTSGEVDKQLASLGEVGDN